MLRCTHLWRTAHGTVSSSDVPRTTRRRFVASGLALGASILAPRRGTKAQAPAAAPGTFAHGVASGDPLASRVILWTRVSGSTDSHVPVRYEIALDTEFRRKVLEGADTACADRDYTVKVDAEGLSPGVTYYYRFTALGATSPVGRTRTLPRGRVERARIGVASCSSFASGYFHAYRHLARRDVDFVLHLGDYIYEYGEGTIGNARALDPPHETISLTDYRRRYALHRRDPDLALLHATHPFIAIWDDHELANDAFRGGAENHSPEEGTWAQRKRDATRAYLEWMPVREGEHGILHRAFHVGDLASLFVLDTRLEGRDRQARWHLDHAVLDDPSRQLLGLAQEAWVVDGVTSARSTYKIIASQVMLAPLRRPRASPTEHASPLRTDTWDGYPEARARLLRAVAARNVRDLVVLSGDIHSSWVSELTQDPYDPTHYDPVTGRGAIGVEFVTPSITSPSVVPREALAGLLTTNRHVQWAELTRSGYLLVELSERGITASYTLFDDVTAVETRAETAATFRVGRGASHIEAVRTAV